MGRSGLFLGRGEHSSRGTLSCGASESRSAVNDVQSRNISMAARYSCVHCLVKKARQLSCNKGVAFLSPYRGVDAVSCKYLDGALLRRLVRGLEVVVQRIVLRAQPLVLALAYVVIDQDVDNLWWRG